MRRNERGYPAKERLVLGGEWVAGVAVDINLSDERSVEKDGNDDFCLCFDAAAEVIFGSAHIRDDKRFEAFGALTADSTTVGDLGMVGRIPAEGTEYEQALVGHGEVETEPIVMRDLPTKQITDKLQTLTGLFGRR